MTLQFIFFDGEEAFKTWTATDSIYGARHLAGKWEQPYVYGNYHGTFLDRIDIFVLLDLLGAKNPQLYSLNPKTHVRSYHFYKMAIHKNRGIFLEMVRKTVSDRKLSYAITLGWWPENILGPAQPSH